MAEEMACDIQGWAIKDIAASFVAFQVTMGKAAAMMGRYSGISMGWRGAEVPTSSQHPLSSGQ